MKYLLEGWNGPGLPSRKEICMKKKSEKKLVLNREVVRELSTEETRKVVGGEHTYTCDSCACNW